MRAGKVTIPTCMHLDQREIDAIARWSEETKFCFDLNPHEDEECVVSSPFTFHLYTTGLGDVAYVQCYLKTNGLGEILYERLSYGIDDDNNLYIHAEQVKDG